MALSPDQRAALQLLLERGQSYADLARLLGVEEGEVRERARSALTEIGGADPDRNVNLTDYLVGQADAIDRADVSRHLREDAADHALATDLVSRLREAFPGAELPKLPGEPRRPRRPLAARAGRPEAAPGADAGGPAASLALSERQTRLLVALGSGALLLVVAVLAIAGVFGGGEDDAQTASGSETTAGVTGDEEIQRVALSSPGGGDAAGEAIFGLATGDQPYVQFDIAGLDPAPAGQSYVIWLLLTERRGYPLTPIQVTQGGTFSDRFAIPSAVLPVIARVRFVDISIAPDREIRRLVGGAIEEQAIVLEKPGETVVRGAIPRAGAEEAAGAGAGG